MSHSLQIIDPALKSSSACLRKLSFPILKRRKKILIQSYPKQKDSLIVMDTFKGQDNAEIKELSSKNECELVIVPYNLTSKFQPLDITIKQKAKKVITV